MMILPATQRSHPCLQVLSVIKVAWEDDSDPEKGFRYLYLTPEDYLKGPVTYDVSLTLHCHTHATYQ